MFFIKKKQKNNLKLGDIVKHVNDSGYIFNDVNNDLGEAAEEIMNSTPVIRMAYGYARRIAVAALYIQGLVEDDTYDHVKAIFKSLQIQTGHSVEFQEEAFSIAVEYLCEYHHMNTSFMVKNIISIADSYEMSHANLDDAQLFQAVLETAHKDQTKSPIASSKKSHFYLMGLSGEKLNAPIHIHHDTFKPAFEVNPNALLNPGNAFDCFGTFLVTLLGPNFRPKGLTCRVSGVNHMLSRRGVLDGVIAHVDMVRDMGEGPIERVHITLRDDGSVIGLKKNSNEYKEIDLNEVYFSYGDTIFLDGDGQPLDDMNKPQPTMRQKEFLQEDKEKRISDLLER